MSRRRHTDVRSFLILVLPSLLLTSYVGYQQIPPPVAVNTVVAETLAVLHNHLGREYALCLEVGQRGDTLWVKDIDAALVRGYSAINITEWSCRFDRRPIGLWHNHLWDAAPETGDGCFFSDGDIESMQSNNVLIGLVSCGYPGQSRLLYWLHPQWQQVLADTL